ncbi:hypothetical protein ACEPAH_3778 [Sanghuangporus vaninii]
MVKLSYTLSALALLVFTRAVVAHPHAHIEAELVKRREFQIATRSSLVGCQSKLRARGGMAERSIARRKTFAERIRKARGLDTDRPFKRKRDLNTVLDTSHLLNATGLTAESDPFDENVGSCILGPEVTQGPYHLLSLSFPYSRRADFIAVVSGEYIRSNVTDGQSGIPLYADLEIIDVTTCEPVSGLYMDFWHANSTGVYSGVVTSGNGVGADDPANIKNTALRGIQQTSDGGFVQFISVFPGHYTGRTTHIHLMVHQTDGSSNANDTYTGGAIAHVGQVFFDQDFIAEVDTVSPYSTNSNQITENSDRRLDPRRRS